MKQDLLDHTIAQIRNESVDPAVIEAAADRVRARIVAPAHRDTNLQQIRGCADFQALIPGYLDRSLSNARRLLLEDHTYSCVYCRHSLEFARTGKSPVLRRPVVSQKELAPSWKVAIAASVALIVGLSTWQIYRLVAPGQNAGATVKTVSGTLFAVSDAGPGLVFSGQSVQDRQHIRTRDGSDAMLRLADGSEVELNARTEVWFDRTLRETTIHLTRGSIIVHAAKQRNGALHVATADCLVSVKGTIFAVDSGVKGSRVSVVEGAVQVEQGSQKRLLQPGQQATTSMAVQATAVSSEVAWSRDSAKYLAILGEFSAMAGRLAQVPQPGLRYSSKLAELAPANTVLYAAIPNIGPLVSEADRIFNDRLSQSAVLSQWWSEHRPQSGPSVDEVIQRVRTFSDYLGSEVALAIALDPDTKAAVPLIMAEVTRPGLSAFLASQVGQINAQSKTSLLRVLDVIPGANTETAGHAAPNQMLAYVGGNYLFVSTSAALLSQADEAAREQRARGNYSLYPRIEQAYQSGAGWLLAADMEQIRATSVDLHEAKSEVDRQMAATGIQNLDSVVLERKDLNGAAQTTASLAFSGGREGMAGWLAAPAPMGSLDFVSPNAGMVTAAVVKGHGGIIWDLLSSIQAGDPEIGDRLREFQQNGGSSTLNTLANSLGCDFMFAIDGAVLPIPSWKVAVEVYSPSNLEWSLEQFISTFNQQPEAKMKLHLAKTDSNGRTFYAVTLDGVPAAAHYTFVDNYFLAAASQDLLTQAIQNRQTGYTLSRSENFRAQLPSDGRTGFSGLLYYNAGPALAAFSQVLNASNAVTPDHKKAVAAFAATSKPGLVYAYSEPDRILVSSKGSFLGLNIDTLSIPAVLSATMHNQFNTGAKPN